MMIQLTAKEIELYRKLKKAKNKEEFDKINAELTRIAKEQEKELKHLPFA